MLVLKNRWGTARFKMEENHEPMDVFRGALSDEVKESAGEMLSNIKDPNDMVTQLVNANKMISTSFRVPDEHSSEEDWGKFFERVGNVEGVYLGKDDAQLRKSMNVPDDPDGYQLDTTKIPEGLNIDNDDVEQLKKYWHDMGFSPKKAQEAFDRFVEGEKASQAEMTTKQEANEAALKKLFGDAHDERLNEIDHVAKSVFEEADFKYLQDLGLFRQPGFAKFMSDYTNMLRDTNQLPKNSPQRFNMAPEEAKEKITEIRNNPAYFDESHPQHKAVVARANELYTIAYPE